jgi:alanyl-tRNA synthetase
MIKQLAQIIGGGGGGSPEMAQAGGVKPEGLDDALKSVFNIINIKSSRMS